MKINWLRLEERIRDILKSYYEQELGGDTAIDLIDDVIGEETGRGWESEAAERRHNESDRV